jgi:hypothetical protein
MVSKDVTEKRCVLKVLDRTNQFDRFGNCELAQTQREISIEINCILNRAHILHNCSGDCRITGDRDNFTFSHSQDGKFILNSFSFSADHEGDPNHYIE